VIDVKKIRNKERDAHMWHAGLECFALLFFIIVWSSCFVIHGPPKITITCIHIRMRIDLLHLTLALSTSFFPD